MAGVFNLNLANVLSVFVKMGAVSFGGGAALIPVIENELVRKTKWLDENEFNKQVVVAGISPASIPVSICAIWNSRYSLFSAFFYAIPGPVIFMVFLTAFAFMGQTGMRYISYASVGIITFILMLLFKFVRNNYLRAKKAKLKKPYLIIMALSFVLSCGNQIRRLAARLFFIFDPPPSVFALDMIILLAIALFVILFMGNSKSIIKLSFASIVSFIFAIASGRLSLLDTINLPYINNPVKTTFVLGGVMVIAVIVSICMDYLRSRDGKEKIRYKLDFKPIRNLLFFFLFAAGLTMLVFVISNDAGAIDFSVKVLISSLSSFGGGEAYIGVADAVFVQSGFIASEDYLGKIVGISSAMPGPVLVSIATGIGYVYGEATGGVGYGWMFGFLGIAMAVSATAMAALTLYTFFELFAASERLKMVLKYIMPVVSGMLASIALNLLTRNIEVCVSVGVPRFIGLFAMIMMFLTMLYLSRRYNVRDPMLLLGGGLISLTVLGVFSI